eukprot:scaffold145569_cov133-Phaeocystis_antarctica.AAC.3
MLSAAVLAAPAHPQRDLLFASFPVTPIDNPSPMCTVESYMDTVRRDASATPHGVCAAESFYW